MEKPIYLVVEPIEIIAADLAMNVHDYDPTAEVITATTLDAAFQVIDKAPSIRFAFIGIDARNFALSDLFTALVERGARIIFVGGYGEPSESGALVLETPFSAQSTADLLEHAEREINA